MQKKIFSYIMAVLIITLSISGFFTAQTIKQLHYEEIDQKLRAEAYILSQMLSSDVAARNTASIQEEVLRVGKDVQVRITVIDDQGKVLGETSYNPVLMENHRPRPEIQEALKGNVGKAIRLSTTVKVDYMYIAQPIYKDGKIVGVVRCSTSLREINSIMKSISKNTLLAFIPGLILSLVMVYRIAVSFTRPIKEIKNIAVDITHGNLDNQTNIISGDEIGELAKAIDFMGASLREKINSIKDKNTKMEAIMSSVVNGIIAVDSSKNILFINPMAQQMLNITETDIAGKPLLHVIRNNKIDNMIKDLLDNSRIEENELTLSYPTERIFRLYSNAIRYPESQTIIGIIIVIQDITELRKLERIRSEFVANVSHELKTPLTSIKGFVETLKSGALEDKDAAERFLSIIEDEADRLNRLITDILSLSELENKKAKARIEVIDTLNKTMEIVSMLQNQASKKNIELVTRLDADVSKLNGDTDRFKQMLINVIDNAIKYTPEGGRVEVAVHNAEQNVVIRVKDNGIGIPAEHISRLFERFYRVDKARSRNVGGTGLGLAIVKHIVMQFEGKIEVQSQLGKGTEFILTIPTKADGHA